jgi:uncharacterized repeat protein (TIGR01451 family)
MKRRNQKLHKIFSLISGISLIFNSILPASVLPLLVTPAYAQEETPTPTDTVTPTPQPEADRPLDETITEAPTPTEEPTITPTPVITETPTEAPTPTEEATPSPTPEELTPTPTEVAQPTETSPPSEQGQILDGASTVAPTAEITGSQPQTDTVSEQKEHGTLQAMILSNTNAETLDINFDSTQPSGSATLTTDKADYAPTDTVVIAGTGFTAGKTYTLIINSQDPPAITHEAQITINAQGDFIYSYQLDGTYRPNYQVIVTNQSGKVIATTTFTDSKNLVTNFAGTGSGVVTSTSNPTQPTQINCTSTGGVFSGTCSVSFSNNYSTVSLSAAPAASSTIGGWNVPTGSSGFTSIVGCGSTDLTCQFNLNNKSGTVTVTFNSTITPTPTPFGPVSIQSTQCMGDQPTAPSGLNCTANDIQVAFVDNIHIVANGPDANNLTPTSNQECEYPGQYIQFTASWHVQSTATSRYNVGLWFANSGQTNALHGTCSASTLPNSPTPFFEDTDDQCGDIHSGSTGTVSPDITVIAQCNAAPGTNQLRLPYCSSWDNNEQTGNACNSPAGTVPGTPSKCSCDDSFSIPIIVPFEAKIEVIKTLSPTDDPGRFNLQVNGSTEEACVGNNGTTGQVTVGAGTSNDPGDTHTVGETACTDPSTNLSDYTSSITCVDRGLSTFDGGAALTQSGTGPLNVPVDEDDDIVCTITNNVPSAHLTLVKTITNDDGGSATATDWTLSASGPTNISGATGDTSVTNAVADPGVYTLSESSTPTGYTASSWSCVKNNDAPVDGSSITLAGGDNATCTINNNDQQAYIIVDKTVVNNNGGSAQPNDFLLTVDGNAVSDGVAYAVNPGAHTAGETLLPGYTAGAWDRDCNVNAGVTVALGETKTCTITNDDQQAYITVVKVVTNDNGGSADPDDFDLTLEGNPVLSGVAVPVNPGTYTAGETLVSGYTFEGFSGDCDTNGDTTVALGESKTCTLTNNDIAPTLTLVKIVEGGDGVPADWTLNATGPTGFSGTGPTVSSGASFDAGTYDLSESGPSDYTASDWLCVGGNQTDSDTVGVGLGNNVMCTLTNTRDTGTLRILKNVDLNGDGDYIDPGETGATDWQWQAYGPVNQTGNTGDTAITVPTGNYILAETPKTGFHLESLSCSGGTLTLFTVAVTNDANVVCTFRNKRDTGTITIDKVTDPSGAPDIFTINLNQGPAQTPTLIHSSTLTDQDTPDTYTVITGEYWLAELEKTGWDLTDATCTDGTASFDPRADSFTITKDVHLTCTFTNTQRGSISGHKLEDGTQNPLEGWVIQLWQWVTGAFVNTGTTDTTDANGFFSFENLIPDLYQLREVLQGGWTKIFPAGEGINVTLDPGESDENNDFVNFELGQITGCKYVDVNSSYTKDEGDTTLSNITMVLSKYIVSSWVPQTSQETLGNGCTVFTGLSSGQYRVTEDYSDTDLNDYYPANGTKAEQKQDVTVTSGSSHTVDFLNVHYRTISGTKYNDVNGNGAQDAGESGLENWTIQLNTGDSTTTDANGYYEFTNLVADSYTIAEDLQTGWTQTQPAAGHYDADVHFALTSTGNDFGNVQLGNIHGYKWNDIDGDGQRGDEELLSGWTIFLDLNKNGVLDNEEPSMETSSLTAHFGWYWFENLLPGEYQVCEELQNGWVQTSSPVCHTVQLPYGDGENTCGPAQANATTEELPTCNFGNQQLNPILTITKQNFAGGDKHPGDNVLFEITVTATQSAAYNVEVTDLLPSGFTYRPGSWTGTATEPVYASPGVWQLGDMAKNEKVTLTYSADISGSQQAGRYFDLAWASGCKTDASCTNDVLAYAINPGFVADNYVGTEVNIVTNTQNGLSHNVVTTVEGQVLGASTELPATGANTFWLYIAFALITGGISIGALGWFLRRKYA